MNEYPKQKMKETWIRERITDETVTWADSFGKFLQAGGDKKKKLTTSQIRKFFGELKRIQSAPEKYKDDFPMLKAKLAYAVGRSRDTRIEQFYEELEKGMNSVRLMDDTAYKHDLINFVKIVEAIVAYHKFHGGE